MKPHEYSRHSGWWLRCVVLGLASLYPFAIAYGNFAGIEPLDRFAVWRTVAGSCGLTLALFWGLRAALSDRNARTVWLVGVLLVCGTYGIAMNSLRLMGLSIQALSPLVAGGYALGAVVVMTVIVKPWRQVRRDLTTVLIIAGVLVGLNMYRGISRFWSSPSSRWRTASNAVISAAVHDAPPRGTTPTRDIYYIVLDGLGRADTLHDIYGVDAGPFLAFLKARGFYVAAGARSNYAQTLLSFSSVLNLTYLDPVATAVGRDSESWLPLADLIQRNSLMRIAKAAGYQVVAVGSDYGPTKRFDEADVCVCQQRGLDMFEQAVIGITPLLALPMDRWTYGAHRSKVLGALDAASNREADAHRQFVFVHVLTPHPPFTFAPDGSFRRPGRPFMFNEGSDFPGPRQEYVRGYRDQAAFLLQRLQATVATILNRPGAKPVIILHGDHGPGSMLQQDDVTRTDLAERMNIFAAYYFPDGGAGLYPSITPVNGVRLLANRYLATHLPLLRDESFFSPARHPFDFTPVPPESTSRSR